MSERKAFLLRIDPEVLDAVQRWANDDLRSLNAQIEFVLRKVLKQEGRLASARIAARATGPRQSPDSAPAAGGRRRRAPSAANSCRTLEGCPRPV